MNEAAQAREPVVDLFRSAAHKKVDELFDMYAEGAPLWIVSEVAVTTTGPVSVDDTCVISIKPAHL